MKNESRKEVTRKEERENLRSRMRLKNEEERWRMTVTARVC